MSDSKKQSQKLVKTIVVKATLAGASEFNWTRDIDFDVGKIVCERIIWTTATTASGVSTEIKSLLFDGESVGVFGCDTLNSADAATLNVSANFDSGCEIQYKQPKIIRGTHKFTLTAIDGSATTRTGTVFIFLKFYEF